MRPLVAIVGRPNVGKSSLFNRLVGSPVAIVDPTPGTTRDRILHEVRRDGLRFDLVDTGGIGIVDEAKLESEVYRQVQRAINAADRILFLVDVRDGLCHLDREVAAQLRLVKDRVLLIVNKVDHFNLDHEVHQFAVLGLGEPLPLSAAQGHGMEELFAAIGEGHPEFTDTKEAERDDGTIKLCLVGRRNVGKSSLTNALCGEERVIVADLPGTTRDAVDVPILRGDGRFVLIDTAGLRKRNDIEDDIEFYAACRTERAIRRSDVCLLVLDASDEIAAVDKKIAQYCELEGKPTILVLNKWDIAEKAHASHTSYLTWLHDRLPGLRYAPAIFTCALSGLNVDDLLVTAKELVAESASRASTSEVNDLLKAALQKRRPRKVGNGGTKIYFGTQAESTPPTFVFFVNRTDYVDAGWTRYLEGFLRERLGCRRVPMRLLFKSRDSRFHETTDEHFVIDGKSKAEHNHHLVLPRKRSYRDRRLKSTAPGDPAAEGEAQP